MNNKTYSDRIVTTLRAVGKEVQEKEVKIVMIVNGRIVGYLSVSEFSEKYRIPRVTIRYWLEEGKIPHDQYVKIANMYWIKEDTAIPKLKPGRPKKHGKDE